MLRKLCAVFIAFALMFTVSACGSSQESSENEQSGNSGKTESKDGEWELYENQANALPDKVQAAFDKATERYTGKQLKPVVYVASQVVAGTNYMILCETGAESQGVSYQMVIVYADLDGKAEITQVKEFDLRAYTEGSSTQINPEKLAGGWEVAEEKSSVLMGQEVKDFFDKAKEDLDGNELEPAALLGTNRLNGMSYAFFCFSTLQTDETINGIQVVTVHEGSDGSIDIVNICPVDPADYNK